MLKPLAPLLLALLPLAAGADVYKWVDERGNVVFSDQPRDNAQKIEMRAPQTFQSNVTSPVADTGTSPPPEVTATSYSDLAILSPANDATVRENAGNVAVSIAITPALDAAAGHYLRVLLDGNIAADRVTSLSVTLPNVDRGTHTLEVQARDAGGKLVRTSGPSVFHLQRASAPR